MSNIDPLVPASGNPTTQSVRDNFATAKAEIGDLQLPRVLRLEYFNESTEAFQACAVNDTPQVVQFTSTRFLNPAGTSVFEFDSVNNEIVMHETGWYHVDLNLHVVRKVAGAANVDWSVHAQLKVPSGSFTNFGVSRRIKTFDGAFANFKEFVTVSFVTQVTVADTRLRWMQACADVTKNMGIIAYAAVSPYPSAAGAVLSMHRLGSL